MSKARKIIALLLTMVILSTAAVLTVNATAGEEEAAGADGASKITVHYKSESGTTPYIYYWNSLPVNIETEYPGKQMAKDTAQGEDWYSYTFNDLTKINMLFIENGEQSKELTRNTGEYWYANNRWYTRNPEFIDDIERTDFREETIYFVITTRFYDGDTGNNVHCWDDSKAGNPDSDPAWRGDFQGLIDKLDYIKALGFSAIWITPVVSNASGYDYHGYHAFDFTTVDPRYESSGATFQDLIDAVHEKGMKIVQDVVWNHTGNFGEAFLAPMFEKVYNDVKDLEDINSLVPIEGSEFAKSYPNYASLSADAQYQARLSIMKNTDGKDHDVNDYYHHSPDMGYESKIEQTGQIAGDCVDINTENQAVATYLTDTYMDYVNMGVDAFRLDTEKHINRWTLNSAYFPVFDKVENFYIFGEVCARVRDVWNHNIPSSSPPFFTWAETKSKWQNNWSTTDWEANYNNAYAHYDEHSNTSGVETSDNAFLNGNDYHTPDYSKSNGTGVIDFSMHWNFDNAGSAFRAGLAEDQYMNDSTWNVVYVDSHDYSPDSCQTVRFNFGTQTWAENLCLMFTFRGIPCLFYGSEIEFQKDQVIDVGPNAPLSTTGRAYFGDHLEGTVTATDFSEYTASGEVEETLNYPLAKHIQRLNQIRRAIPALQKGQYSTENVSGDMAYKRRYTDDTVDSFVCVSVTNAATFTNIPNGTYIDAVTGDVKNVTNGTLSIAASGKGNMRVYVLSSGGFDGISGKIGTDGTYLK